MELFRILLHRFGVQNLAVVLARLEILVVVLSKGDLLLVISQLEIRDVVFLLFRRIIHTARLLSFCSILLLLLQLLCCLFRLAREIFGGDLPAKNSSLRPVTLLNAKRHLLQDEFRLLPSLHGSESLDLKLA